MTPVGWLQSSLRGAPTLSNESKKHTSNDNSVARATDVEPNFYGMPNMNGYNTTTYIATLSKASCL